MRGQFGDWNIVNFNPKKMLKIGTYPGIWILNLSASDQRRVS